MQAAGPAAGEGALQGDRQTRVPQADSDLAPTPYLES